jgi:hypothetical protein
MDGPEGKKWKSFYKRLGKLQYNSNGGLNLNGNYGYPEMEPIPYPFIIYVEILLLACRPGLDSNLCQSFHIGTYVFLGSTMEEDH